MVMRFRTEWAVGGVTLLLLLSTACTRPSPAAAPGVAGSTQPTAEVPGTVATPEAAATGSTRGRQSAVAARRGHIVEELPLYGRVAGLEEVTLTFQGRGRVETVAVKPGQTVNKGDVLLETDTKEITRQLEAARTQLESTRLSLDQVRRQRQNAVTDSEAALRKAKAELERTIAAATGAEQQSADAAVETARASLKRAEAERDRVTAGPNADAVRAAEREALSAKVGLDRAQADLDRLMKGPDSSAIRVAEREVGRAQEALSAAQGLAAPDDKSRASRDQAISDAQLNLQDAQNRLARLRQAPLPSEMELAQYNLDAAKLVADAARERLQRLKAGPDPDAVEKANAAVDAARATLQIAEARSAEVSARASREQSDAEERVSAAATALDRARSAASGKEDDPDHQQVVLLEKSLERGQSTVKELEDQLASMRVAAPIAGAVVAIMARPGDQLEPGKPVAVLAKPGDPIVRVELSEQEAGRVAIGQRATVRLDADDSQPLSGTVAAIIQTEDSAARIAHIQVTWPSVPSYGAVAKTAVAVQEKDNVLLVPKPALRSAGARKYVESAEGTNRRSVDVEVGIAGATDVEIVRGLREGQIVLVGTGA